MFYKHQYLNAKSMLIDIIIVSWSDSEQLNFIFNSIHKYKYFLLFDNDQLVVTIVIFKKSTIDTNIKFNNKHTKFNVQ